MPRSVDAFKSRIQQFQQVRTQREKAGSVSQKEMQQALTELTDASGNVSGANLKAAQDLFKSDVGMTRGGREMLKGFIEQNAPAGPSHGTGLRTMQSAAELQAYLQDPGVLDGVFSAAFGNAAMSRSASREVGTVTELPNGNFEVDLQLVHWRTRGVMATGTAELNGAGSVVDADVQLPQDPRDRKIASDGPIGPLGGGGGRVLKVRADDPIPDVPNDAPPDPRDVKITADGPIGGSRPRGRVLKVRADDPIPDVANDPPASRPAPRDSGPRDSGPRDSGPRGPSGPIGGVFKIRSDDPI